MTIQLTLSEDEARDLLHHCSELDRLHEEENRNGRADFEVFDLEGAMGNYEWLVRRIVESL